MAHRAAIVDSVESECVFCTIVKEPERCARVFEDGDTVVFLDHRPLFPGHCLLVTKNHVPTLAELPASLVQPVFANVRMITLAVRNGMNAEGTFVAINNVVSQSVPHFHVHIVPRRKGDGLRGFFWPRGKYDSEEQAAAVASAIRKEIERLKSI